ncbi:MAG: class I SAM-dependent methyltransferase [Chitinophagaceae bacterium]
MNFFQNDTKSAFEAKEAAQWIAFGPVIFQSARVLRNSGILSAVEDSGEVGISLEEIARKVKISLYGARVLLESGLSLKLVTFNGGNYRLAKTGYFVLHDDLTKTNMDFVHDVCYKGLFSLDKSIESGKPEGLKEFGAWRTIYEGLSGLPEQVQKSWFNFDHFFSDNAFPLVLSKVLKNGPKKMLDIGGNTGKWAIACTGYNSELEITIVDLPGQLDVARDRIGKLGLTNRVSFHAANMLDDNQRLPAGHDAVWMSQFLDCFSEDEIVLILQKCYSALVDNGCLYILEPFWDKQRFEIAAFCLQQTSLYFTALANGNSQMYHSETFIRCIENAGFIITEQQDNIGLSQTLLKCIKRSAL